MGVFLRVDVGVCTGVCVGVGESVWESVIKMVCACMLVCVGVGVCAYMRERKSWLSRMLSDVHLTSPYHQKLGSGVKTQKEMLLLSKKDKTQFSWASDVGVFYSITDTRFPYYISVRTIWWVLHNVLVLVQTKPQKWVRNPQSEEWVSTAGILPPLPTSPSDRGWR